MINASESITVSQSQGDSSETAGIAANALLLNDPLLADVFSLPQQPMGDTGELRVTTPLLILTDGGRISVQHQGTGNAGELDIEAGHIWLTDGGQITAETLDGEGGDINVRAQSLLVLENEGVISAESQVEGDGGNINIEALFTLGSNNSDIVANAACVYVCLLHFIVCCTSH